jgi:threonine dehydrogenase-like Zn-dependent dehydrogenase
MGIAPGGKMAALASAGPMGLAFIDYMLHNDRKPSVLAVTDIDDARLERAASILTVAEAARQGVRLIYLNTKKNGGARALMEITGGEGYDDVFVFAPLSPVIEQADDILGYDGCLNFFAGPPDTDFKAKFNFYDVHYNSSHIVGTYGGNTDDMREALELFAAGRVDPSILVTHIGGLDAAAEATLHLPEIPGGKKLIYTHISLPLTAISDFGKLGETDGMFRELDRICSASNALWNPEAERFLLEHAPSLT